MNKFEIFRAQEAGDRSRLQSVELRAHLLKGDELGLQDRELALQSCRPKSKPAVLYLSGIAIYLNFIQLLNCLLESFSAFFQGRVKPLLKPDWDGLVSRGLSKRVKMVPKHSFF